MPGEVGEADLQLAQPEDLPSVCRPSTGVPQTDGRWGFFVGSLDTTPTPPFQGSGHHFPLLILGFGAMNRIRFRRAGFLCNLT